MYFQGSLDMVCKYQPHKLNKCELFKAVSPALLIEILRFASIWHHSGLYQTIMMSLKGTLSFFLYNAPHFQRLKSNLAIESLSWQDEVHSFAILI